MRKFQMRTIPSNNIKLQLYVIIENDVKTCRTREEDACYYYMQRVHGGEKRINSKQIEEISEESKPSPYKTANKSPKLK